MPKLAPILAQGHNAPMPEQHTPYADIIDTFDRLDAKLDRLPTKDFWLSSLFAMFAFLTVVSVIAH